jgi:hypothetical protein
MMRWLKTNGWIFAALIWAWEIGLVAQLERDKTANFRVFPASA